MNTGDANQADDPTPGQQLGHHSQSIVGHCTVAVRSNVISKQRQVRKIGQQGSVRGANEGRDSNYIRISLAIRAHLQSLHVLRAVARSLGFHIHRYINEDFTQHG